IGYLLCAEPRLTSDAGRGDDPRALSGRPWEPRVKPAAFEYHVPEKTSDVVSLLREHGDDAKVLAGGQSLVPMLALRLTRFPHLVDVNRVSDLGGIERQDGMLGIGAITRQSTLERDSS